jgi:hypothetical protein
MLARATTEAKRAEFLVHGSFPWSLVEAVSGLGGLTSAMLAEMLEDILQPARM